jgi:asparagine synthase (glutamine-hydrolysing)
MPELANYLRQGRFLKLASRSFEWCMVDRTPLVEMLWGAVSFTGRLYRNSSPSHDTIPPWLSQELRQVCRHYRSFSANTRELVTARPSALSNGQTWWGLLETLPHLVPNPLGRYEFRYPYLDRDLVEFLHRIPREQLVQPGRRRLLMRRALKEIVPTEILERKRKAFISRGPIAHLRDSQPQVFDLFANPLLAAYGFIDRDKFLRAFQAELAGGLKWVGHLTKAISLELWLRSLGTPPRLHSEAKPNLGAMFCPSSEGQTVSELEMLEGGIPGAEI